MATFQVVVLRPMAGISKTSQKPYNMLIAKGIFTNDQGEVDTAELVFMENSQRPLPKLVVGQKYEPQISMYVNREGKLVSNVESLRLAASAVVTPVRAS